MKKRDQLYAWAQRQGDWFYLRQVPLAQVGMSLQTASTALRDMAERGRLQSRIVGLTQYRAVSK